MALHVNAGSLRRLGFRAGAGAVLLLAAAEIVFELASLGAPYADPRSVRSIVEMALAHAASLAACGIGFALVWRAAHRPAARALTWFLAVFALFWASVYLNGTFDDDAPGLPAWLGALLELNAPIIHLAVWVAPAAFLRFSVLFPRPLEPADLTLAPGAWAPAGGSRRRRFAWRVARLAARSVYWLRRRLLGPRRVWAIALVAGSTPLLLYAAARLAGLEHVGVGAGAPLPARIGAGAFALLVVSFVLVGAPAAIAISALNLRLSYRLADAGGRRRIRWIADGCMLGAVALFAKPVLEMAFGLAGFDHPVADAIPGAIFSVGILAMVVCLAVGVFYDGALDSALIVRRSAVYTAFGVFLTFVFAGIENIVSSYLSARLGLPDGASSFVAGGSAALAFGALRRTVHRVAGRVAAPDRSMVEAGGGPGPADPQESAWT